ncbi:hypothetical protein FRC08_010606 [Ceratobasidium sp. 394]|nr:hypothetical protein FRC08_010606 [Ceratobasidium sp. 394]
MAGGETWERPPQLTSAHAGRHRETRREEVGFSLLTGLAYPLLLLALDDHIHDSRRSRHRKMKVKAAKRAGPACAAGVDTWWNNAQGSTPCDVYQSIMDKCSYTAPAIASNDAYYPVLQAQNCMCNTVAYNLGSACQDCQRGTTDQGILFSVYVAGGDTCPLIDNNLPDSVTPTDDIPTWAFLDTSTQFWSYSAAREIALNQTSTTASSGPTSTGATMTDTTSATHTLTPTGTPSTSASAAPVSSGHNSVKAGAIGGGVAGGVVLLLVVIGLLLFWRRRRARQSRGMVIGAAGEDGSRNASASSESSLTESGKAVGATSHYTPHSQMAQLNHPGGSGIIIAGSYSTTSALATPIDAPPLSAVSHDHTTSIPSRSLATSPVPSVPPSTSTNRVKRVPVRYSPDELALAEQAEIDARRAATGQQ